MKIRYFLILTILLGNSFGCQVNSQEKSQTNQSQTNQKDAAPAKNGPLKLKLNYDDAGTTDNTSILSETLGRIFKDRENSGVFRQGSNEIEKTVYLGSDRSVSAEEIAKLFGVLNNLRASPILVPVPVQTKEQVLMPNPLTLYLYAGSGESRSARAGIEIGFIGELSESPGNVPPDKNPIILVASKNGAYTMGGKQISASDLKTAIEKRLKTKEKNKKTIFVQADNYGNIEDAASIAASAGVGKVYFITKNIKKKENDISFSLPPAFLKDKDEDEDEEQIPKQTSFKFKGPDSQFEIITSDELIDKEEAESAIDSEYEYRKENYKQSEVSKTKIDGSSGVLIVQNDEEGYFAFGRVFARKKGKHQLVLISFGCEREESSYCNSEFLTIIKSIKFN